MNDAKEAGRHLQGHILARVPPEEIEALARKCRRRRYEARSVIIHAREHCTDVLLVQSGTARVSSFSDDGRQVIHKDIGPGDMVGDFAAIDGLPRSASVVTLTACEIAHLPGPVFLDYLLHSPEAVLWELRELARHVRVMTDRYVELLTLPLRSRLCAYLLRLASGADSAPWQPITLPLHQDIADLLGSQREAVTKALSSLEQSGAIRRSGATMDVCRGRLEEIIAG